MKFNKFQTLLLTWLAVLLVLFVGSNAFGSSLRTNNSQQFTSASVDRNYILNSGAESNDLNVTDASGIVSRVTSGALEGDGSFQINATAGSQTVVFLGAAFQAGLLGQGCQASFTYSGDASLYTAYPTLNGVAQASAVTLLNVPSGSSQEIIMPFPCGTSGTDVASVVIASTGDGAAILVDSVKIGAADSISSVAQSYDFGSLTYAATASCEWSSSGVSATPPAFSADTDCATPTVTGRVKAPGTKIPAFIIPAGSPSGTYRIDMTGRFECQRSSTICNSVFFLYDGTTYSNAQYVGTNTTGSSATTLASRAPNLIGSYSYTSSSSDVTIEIRGYAVTSGSSPLTQINAVEAGLVFGVSYFPTSSQIVQRADLTAVAVEANGTPTGSLTAASATIWGTEVRDVTGSYNPATGAFTAPSTQTYCFNAAVVVGGTEANNDRTILVPYVDGVALTRFGGLSRVMNTGLSSFQAQSNGCTALNVGQVLTFRTDCDTSGCAFVSTSSQNYLSIVSAGGPTARAFIPGSVYFGRSNMVKEGAAVVSCGTTGSIISNPDSMLSTLGNISGSTCTGAFSASYFNSTPECLISGKGNLRALSVSASSSTAFTVICENFAGTACSAANNLQIRCWANQ